MINLIIAHSHPVFLVILQNILRSYQGLHIAGKVTNAAGLLQAAAMLKPDIIIADIALPGMKGITALQKLAVSCSGAKVILSWQHSHQRVLSKAIDAGCAGCIIQEANPAGYHLAIKQAMKGEVFYCDHTERVISAGAKGLRTHATLLEIHSEKYGILLHYIWLGYNIKETAVATGLTIETVYTYRKRLKKIFGSLSAASIESLIKKNW